VHGVDFVDHPMLHKPDADIRLFGVAAQFRGSDANRFPEPLPIASTKRHGMPKRTLSSAQERQLFLRLNLARMKAKRILLDAVGGPLPSPATRELIGWAAWEHHARDLIVRLNTSLVWAMAKRTPWGRADLHELVSEGNLALVRCVDRFDCSRGFRFSTYCCSAILRACSRAAARASRRQLVFPVGLDSWIEHGDLAESKREAALSDSLDDLRTVMAENMAHLTPVEQIIIEQRFDLDRPGVAAARPKSLAQMGKALRVSKERVRQIQIGALRKIRVAMEELGMAA